jgi:hypothetical protein
MSRTHDITISAFDLDNLEKELAAERALADRLAYELKIALWQDGPRAVGMTEAVEMWMEARK